LSGARNGCDARTEVRHDSIAEIRGALRFGLCSMTSFFDNIYIAAIFKLLLKPVRTESGTLADQPTFQLFLINVEQN